jgi:hypothetical protein
VNGERTDAGVPHGTALITGFICSLGYINTKLKRLAATQLFML